MPDELWATDNSHAKLSIQLEIPDGGVSLEAVERALILRALEKAGGNQTKAARYLDISRRTLIYRMEKHGIRPEGDSTE